MDAEPVHVTTESSDGLVVAGGLGRLGVADE